MVYSKQGYIMINSKVNQKALIALSQAYALGNTAVTDRIESILLPDNQELPEELQKCLESWGNNPVDESEYAKNIDTATLEEMKMSAIKDLNIDDFNAIDIAVLSDRVYKKITNKIDDDGKYKTTPNIDKAKLPRTTQLRAIKKLATDEVAEEKIYKEIFKIAGVKEKDLSKWEADLIKEMFYAYVQAVDSDTMGSYTDRTPFARYIKN